MVDRGQVYTLEGIVAALVVLAGVFFAIQATTAVPQAAGASGPHAEQHDRSLVASDLISADDETVREAVLYWNTDSGDRGFRCTSGDTQYYTGAIDTSNCASTPPHADAIPPLAFGKSVADTLGPGYTYNVILAYNATGDGRETQRMVYQGEPGDGAVRATTTVVLADGHNLTEADGDATGDPLEDLDSDGFYAGDVDTSSRFYNVVSVEVIAWRA
ncbi:DUF7288 family protein [Halomicrobium salinisoli]|uniref:DUF7288 family protein n=1 Tax=Halomicrobium salinisoli TaxID=2878391 RepID=UPI001CF0B31C|nr:hypothetical protein [Halomicrobium salinisoli]